MKNGVMKASIVIGVIIGSLVIFSKIANIGIFVGNIETMKTDVVNNCNTLSKHGDRITTLETQYKSIMDSQTEMKKDIKDILTAVK